MPDYSKSKIYKIVPTCEYEEGDEYYGSTIRPLSERMNEHRKRTDGCKSKILFEKYGVENCKIELVEEYPCDNKEQLNKREGEYQRENKCINKQIAGRTLKEYQIDNADTLKEQKKQYYEANADKIKEKKKEYQEANIDKIKDKKKAYYETNADKIKANSKAYRESKKINK